MKIVKTTEFMERYKTLERSIRDNIDVDFSSTQGGPVAYYEGLKEGTDIAVKLRYLRMIRNTLAHNPGLDSFITVTDEHLSFLDEVTKEVESRNGTVKDVYLTLAKAPVLSLTSTIQDAVNLFAKKKTNIAYIVDVEKNIFKYLTKDNVITILSTTKVTAKMNKLPIELESFEQPIEKGLTLDTPLTKVEKSKFGTPVIRGKKIVGVYM